MAFIALGTDHKTASVVTRECVAFIPKQMVEALQQLCRLTTSRETTILSTCNRSELYLEIDHPTVDDVLAWLVDYHRLILDELRICTYVHQDEDVVYYMIRVASDLDPTVLGEPQALGQTKLAHAVACEAGTVGPLLGCPLQATFSVVRTVRTDTTAGKNPTSMASAMVSLAKRILSDLHRSQAPLIGAGGAITLVARYLFEQGMKHIMMANRTLERVSLLAEQSGAHVVLLSKIPEGLVNSDIVISSTTGQLPILGKGAVEHTLKQRKYKPMFMIGIAVPRNIEPGVGELSDAYLYSVDDLHGVVAEDLKNRQDAIQAVEGLVDSDITEFMQRLRELAAVDVLCTYRQQAERLRDEELGKVQRQPTNGANPARVMVQLARGLTNKLPYMPSVQMKKVSTESRIDALALAQRLFALDESAPHH